MRRYIYVESPYRDDDVRILVKADNREEAIDILRSNDAKLKCTFSGRVYTMSTSKFIMTSVKTNSVDEAQRRINEIAQQKMREELCYKTGILFVKNTP